MIHFFSETLKLGFKSLHFVIHDGPNQQSTPIVRLRGGVFENIEVSSTGNSLFVDFRVAYRSDWPCGLGFFATIHYGNLFRDIKHLTLK